MIDVTELKVGDVVIVKTHEEMIASGATKADGSNYLIYPSDGGQVFNPTMKKYCGQVAVVGALVNANPGGWPVVHGRRLELVFFDSELIESSSVWYFFDWTLRYATVDEISAARSRILTTFADKTQQIEREIDSLYGALEAIAGKELTAYTRFEAAIKAAEARQTKRWYMPAELISLLVKHNPPFHFRSKDTDGLICGATVKPFDCWLETSTGPDVTKDNFADFELSFDECKTWQRAGVDQ